MNANELRNVAEPVPQGSYQPCVRAGNLVFTAGMTSRVEGVLQHAGHVGVDVGVDEARAAARIATRNALVALRSELGSLDRVRALRLTVYVAAAADFTDHSIVADAASETLNEVLGPPGAAARSAVGVSSLPSGASVEVELTAVREDSCTEPDSAV